MGSVGSPSSGGASGCRFYDKEDRDRICSASAGRGEKMKERLDVLLVKRKCLPIEGEGKAVIMSGNVFVDGQRRIRPVLLFRGSAD